MDIFAYFKDIYDSELKRWDESLKSLYYPTTILIVIIGAVSFLFRGYHYARNDSFEICFIISLVIVLLLMIAAFYFLFKAYSGFKGFDYEILPYANDLKKYYDKLRNHYIDKGEPDKYVDRFQRDNN